MKKTLLILSIFIFAISTNINAQTLNQYAAWPNSNWQVTGDYHTGTDAFESDPTITGQFAFDDRNVHPHYDNSIGALSPIIDLIPALLAGETNIYVEGNFIHRTYSNHVLTLAYWDADVSDWIPWISKFENTDNVPLNDYCSGTYETYKSPYLDISSFTPSQLAGFKYLIYFNDGGASQNYVGFCFQSPTIKSNKPAEITVKGNNIEIVNGTQSTSTSDKTNFGFSCTAISNTFQIYNDGSLPLNLSLPVSIGGANASDFTITAQPASIVPSGLVTNVTVQYNPTAAGVRSAYVTIVSNDADEGTYTFNLEGTSLVPITDVHTVCGSFTWMDGNTYTSDNNIATYYKTGDGSPCGDTLFTLNLTVLQLPNNQVVAAADATICHDNSTTITLASSEEDVQYYLRDDATNDTISGPVTGTGNVISFNTGTLSNTMTYNVNASKIVENTGLEFDGDDDYVQLNEALPLGSSSHTIELWVKIPSVGTGGLASGERVGIILGSYPNNNFTNWEVLSNGTIRVVWDPSNNGFDRSGSKDLRDNTWHHLAFVRDTSANKYQVFIDGELEFTHGSSVGDIPFNSLLKHRIGVDNRPSGEPYFHGAIDNLQYWSYAKTADEIEISMNACVIGDKPGLISHYNFGDGVGSSMLTDASTAGNNGILNNFNTSTAWVDGVVNCFSCSREMLITPTVEVTSIDTSVTDTAPTLTANQTGASYQWVDCNNGNAPISGATSQSYVATASGSYAVEVTVNGCMAISDCKNVTTLSIDKNVIYISVLVYPNPNNGRFYVELGDAVNDDFSLEVFNSLGQIVFTSHSTASQKQLIDLESKAPGIYIVRIFNGQKSIHKKIIVQ